MASIFTKIINREIPAFVVAENEHCIAFLDIKPLAKGHTLVVSKKEVDYIFDLDSTLLNELMQFSKRVAKAIDACKFAKRTGVAVIGLEVPHAHVHLVPINGISDIEFSKPKLELSKDELSEIAVQISSCFI
ncbi:MAG: HIT family protein [Bacteroidetes bacterium HGW-Bacteroidetes-6]|jgi:histidine triad (HIT) family protein|nr:MAG: HIT family protein [Bacteroidetes bacterium HGW-Bacteroidetes-6]